MLSLRAKIMVVSLAAAATLVACTGDPTGVTTSSSSPTSTAVSGSTQGPSETTTTSSVGTPGIDPDVEAELRATIAGLIDITEELRGLEFIEAPNIVVLSPEEVGERVRLLLEEDLDPEELAVDQRFFEMMRMLDGDTDYRALLTALYEEQVAGFYNGETGELVVRGDSAELSPYAKSVVVHELVHALTDQHFDYHDRFVEQVDGKRYDEALALQALLEGDATFHQLSYAQTLPADEIQAWAREQLETDVTVFADSPTFVRESLAYAYQEGFALVSQIVASGGLDALNRAYAAPPQLTEAVLHPERFFSGEAARVVEPLAIDLPGFTVHEAGRYGEWSLRLLLLDAVSLGEVSQAADGWGGDAYAVLADSDDVAFTLEYMGDSERDAIELTETLIAVVEERMGAGEAISEEGGVLYVTEDLYVFIDRVDDRVYFVATTDGDVGPSLRSQLIP